MTFCLRSSAFHSALIMFQYILAVLDCSCCNANTLHLSSIPGCSRTTSSHTFQCLYNLYFGSSYVEFHNSELNSYVAKSITTWLHDASASKTFIGYRRTNWETAVRDKHLCSKYWWCMWPTVLCNLAWVYEWLKWATNNQAWRGMQWLT